MSQSRAARPQPGKTQVGEVTPSHRRRATGTRYVLRSSTSGAPVTGWVRSRIHEVAVPARRRAVSRSIGPYPSSVAGWVSWPRSVSAGIVTTTVAGGAERKVRGESGS